MCATAEAAAVKLNCSTEKFDIKKQGRNFTWIREDQII